MAAACSYPYPTDLVIVRKMLSKSDFSVTDVNGYKLFKVKGKFFTLRDRRVLLDAANNVVLTFKKKIITAHQRWKVFKGDSSDKKDLLFSVRRSCMIQLKTKLEVFLASNKSENECDYKVKGSWFKKSCTVYAGDSTNIIAQMRNKVTLKSRFLGKKTYGVRVYPNVDYAFIVALILILEEINESGVVNVASKGMKAIVLQQYT